jgi:uncharacterized protein YigA (DUF484 family)
MRKEYLHNIAYQHNSNVIEDVFEAFQEFSKIQIVIFRQNSIELIFKNNQFLFLGTKNDYKSSTRVKLTQSSQSLNVLLIASKDDSKFDSVREVFYKVYEHEQNRMNNFFWLDM